MGKIKKGVFGGFSGRIGNIIGSSWNGIAYMRSEAQSIKNPRTDKQIAVRDNFATISRLMGKARFMLRQSDWRKAKGQSAYSKAVQLNYDKAVQSSGIDFEKLSFGSFVCPGLSGSTCSFSVSDNSLRLSMTWTDDTTDTQANRDDNVYIVVAVKSAVGDMDDDIIDILNARREDEELAATIALINSFTSGTKFYAYVGVASSNLYAEITETNEAVMSAQYLVS